MHVNIHIRLVNQRKELQLRKKLQSFDAASQCITRTKLIIGPLPRLATFVKTHDSLAKMKRSLGEVVDVDANSDRVECGICGRLIGRKGLANHRVACKRKHEQQQQDIEYEQELEQRGL